MSTRIRGSSAGAGAPENAALAESVPDFLVMTDDGSHWIVEGKADSEMADSVVVAKRDAAKAWLDTVKSSDDVHVKWAYMLSSETAFKNATNRATLKAASTTHG